MSSVGEQVDLSELYKRVLVLYDRNTRIDNAVSAVAPAIDETGVLHKQNAGAWQSVAQLIEAWEALRERVCKEWDGARGDLPSQDFLKGKFRCVEDLRKFLKDSCAGFTERAKQSYQSNLALIELNDQAVKMRSALITTAQNGDTATQKVKELEARLQQVLQAQLRGQQENATLIANMDDQVSRCQLSCAAVLDQLSSGASTPRSSASNASSYNTLCKDYVANRFKVAMAASKIRLTPEEIARQYGH